MHNLIFDGEDNGSYIMCERENGIEFFYANSKGIEGRFPSQGVVFDASDIRRMAKYFSSFTEEELTNMENNQ